MGDMTVDLWKQRSSISSDPQTKNKVEGHESVHFNHYTQHQNVSSEPQ